MQELIEVVLIVVGILVYVGIFAPYLINSDHMSMVIFGMASSVIIVMFGIYAIYTRIDHYITSNKEERKS